MKTNIIFHIDVNSAFLSWSAVKKLKEDPSAVDLRTVPSAVGGDVESRHGIITAKSIPAKKYGITTGEPVVKALQKCPNLILVKGDFKTYHAYSQQFIGILRSYSSIIEQASIDEAFINMTDALCEMQGAMFQLKEQTTLEEADLRKLAVIIAAQIKDEIYESLGFTVNVGISSNKLLAKMASDFEKPNKVHTLFPDEVEAKMWPLPIGDLYGCGKHTASRLIELGMRTIGDVAHADAALLCGILGEKSGRYLFESANGRSDSVVNPERGDAKSYSNETTTRSDITFNNYDKEMPETLKWLCESVSRRLQHDGFFASTIGISVKTDQFQRRSRQMQIADSTNDAARLFQVAADLMGQLVLGENGLFANGYKIRLVGVSASELDRGEFRQMSLFEMMAQPDPQASGDASASLSQNKNTAPDAGISADAKRAERNRRLAEMTKHIENKFGDGVVKKGT